jgi:hypothetical protein
MRLVNATRRELGLCIQCRKRCQGWRCGDCQAHADALRSQARRQKKASAQQDFEQT